MSLKKFGVFCKRCMDKSKPHLHQVHGLVEFSCLNCGEKEILVLDTRYYPDEVTREKIIERDKLIGELEKLKK